MPTSRILTISIALCFHISVAYAQNLKFKQFTTSDGLLSDEVFDLHQDKTGYIWILTNYGVLKYNGFEFKQVLKNLPFGDSFMYCIYESSSGEKWLANSNAKIYKIRNDSAFQVRGTESVSHELRKKLCEIYQLNVDDSSNIYAVTKHQTYKFVKRGHAYRPVDLSSGEKDSITIRVRENKGRLFRIFNYNGNDSVICGGLKDVKVLVEETKKTTYFSLNCLESHPKHFKRFKGHIYYSHHTQIGKIDDSGNISLIPFHSIILSFTKDKNDHLWVACYNNGLFELNEKDSIINHYFENTTINNILTDSQNGLWVSSTGSGLYYCSNIDDRYFNKNSPFGKPVPWIKRADNELVFGNAIGDIYSIKNGKIESIVIHTTEDEPLDFLKYKDRYIISYRYRIEQPEILPKLLKDQSHLLKASVHRIVKGSGDTVILLQRKKLITIVNGYSESIIDVTYKAFDAIYRNGILLIATENGVYEFRNNKFYQPAYLSETNNRLIKSIVKDSLNNYWFCSIGDGVFKLDVKNKLWHYNASNGLPSDIINGISFFGNQIFCSTNNGLYFHKNVIPGQLYGKTQDWKKIYSGHVENAILFENSIYLATHNGLVILDTKKMGENIKTYFNLSTIKVNGKDKNVLYLKALNHSENNLEFSFDFIDLRSSKVGLKYFLSGQGSDSGLVELNTLSFQKLAPGKYSLTVYPHITNGESLKIAIDFYIKPAFWQTAVFIFFVILFSLLMIAFFARLVFAYYKRKADKKQKAENLILEYKLIALKAQINPHFMSNCLSAIQNLVISSKLEEATSYLARFGYLVRQILNFSGSSVITLFEELEVARLNAELEQLRFERKFLFEIRIDPSINPKEIYVPALLFNPILENAIWHGLLPLKNKRQGRLYIDVRREVNAIRVIIEDNGVGRSPKASNPSNIRESKGIKLTIQRLNNINYLSGKDTATMHFNDLYDHDGNPMGLQVIISLPLNLRPIENE